MEDPKIKTNSVTTRYLVYLPNCMSSTVYPNNYTEDPNNYTEKPNNYTEAIKNKTVTEALVGGKKSVKIYKDI